MYQKREITDFYQKFSRIVRTLKTMNKLDSVEGFVHTIFKKLGPLRENLAAVNEDWEKWTLDDLSENLRKFVDRNNLNSERFENENRYERYNKDYDRKSDNYKQTHKGYKDKTFYNNNDSKFQDTKKKCVFCNYTNHEAKNCLKILDLSKRREIAQSKKLCFLCLKEGHFSNKCKAKKCEKCNGSHHVAICDKSEKSSIPEGDLSEKSMGMIQKRLKLVSIHPTALVEVNGIPARILFDSGSSGHSFQQG